MRKAESSQQAIRLRLDFSYDGGAFSGWSRQPGLRTVQGELEAALATILGRTGEETPSLTVAGRTDAGVHARGQVAHLDLSPTQLASLRSDNRGKGKGVPNDPAGLAASLARRLNGIAGLNSDLVLTAATIAKPGFDARFSAIWRRYEYRIADARARKDPLSRNHVVWYPGSLDEAAMSRAAASLIGLGDFAAYCKPRAGATTIRTLQQFTWERASDGLLIARVQADAFCHGMVRALVGASVAVGERRLGERRPADLLRAGERTNEFKVMPAKGLVLAEVGYPDDEDLAARAEQTRARRGGAFDRDAGAD